jgi:ribose/xylose/arabinose/galactoside ABC-type transport system permease subunit
MKKNELFEREKKLLLVRVTNNLLVKNPRLNTPLIIAVPLVIVFVFFAILNPAFISQRNIFNILRQVAVYMVLGTGMTLVIGNGGIDLSVGSIAGLTACIAGTILEKAAPIIPLVPLAIVTAIIVGLIAGAFNGILVSFLKVPPLITTLGTMTALRGFAYLLMGPAGYVARSFPSSFKFIGQGYIGGIFPFTAVIGLIVVGFGGAILSYSRMGKYILAIGGSQEAAKRCGIKIPIFQIFAYVISGGLAGLGGIILASRLNAAQAILGEGMELHVIAVVIIGGTYLFGGYATMLGTLLGTIFLGVIENGLVLVGVPFYWQLVFIGYLLVAAVSIQLYRSRTIGVG